MARILIVDDNDANRELARATLEDEGHEATVAIGGAEALSAFEKETIDCVLLDVRMPTMDGFEVCERIRALPEGRDVPIIFLTALRDVETFDRALRAGGDDFLTKPVRPTELVVRVSSALQLRRLRAELHDHYELLKKQRDDLMRVQLQKERLTAFIVHDLKSPVHAMDLLAQVLLEEGGGSDQSKAWLTQIRASARQLDRMIRNLLDLSRGDEGAVTPTWTGVALKPLVAEVFGELDVVAKLSSVEQRASLEIDTVHADADLLHRALANLVENAIRHAPKKTEVVVTARECDGLTEIRIADQGPGVPPELRSLIFDPFVSSEGETSPSSRRGHGLGLAFCRLVAQAHGGSISLEGTGGAEFVLRWRAPSQRS